MRRVELFEIMRKDHEFGLSIRAIAEKRGVHRRMVRQALASPVPPERKAPHRHSPVMTDDLKAFIDGILVADKDAPKKQRHSARRLWQRCRDELGSPAAEVTVRRYVRVRRREDGQQERKPRGGRRGPACRGNGFRNGPIGRLEDRFLSFWPQNAGRLRSSAPEEAGQKDQHESRPRECEGQRFSGRGFRGNPLGADRWLFGS